MRVLYLHNTLFLTVNSRAKVEQRKNGSQRAFAPPTLPVHRGPTSACPDPSCAVMSCCCCSHLPLTAQLPA